MIVSGLVLMEPVKWLSFHSGYDFGYLLNVLTNVNLPKTEYEFFETLKVYCPNVYDVKYLMKSCKNLKGGLQVRNKGKLFILMMAFFLQSAHFCVIVVSCKHVIASMKETGKLMLTSEQRHWHYYLLAKVFFAFDPSKISPWPKKGKKAEGSVRHDLIIRFTFQEVANELEVPRIGPQHQAGSDSLLTGQTFFKMKELFFEDDIDDVKYCGHLYGLGTNFVVGSTNASSTNLVGGGSSRIPTPNLLSQGTIKLHKNQALHSC